MRIFKHIHYMIADEISLGINHSSKKHLYTMKIFGRLKDNSFFCDYCFFDDDYVYIIYNYSIFDDTVKITYNKETNLTRIYGYFIISEKWRISNYDNIPEIKQFFRLKKLRKILNEN